MKKIVIVPLGVVFALNVIMRVCRYDFEMANDAGDGAVMMISAFSSQTNSALIELQAIASPDKKYIDLDIKEGFRIEAVSTSAISVV